MGAQLDINEVYQNFSVKQKKRKKTSLYFSFFNYKNDDNTTHLIKV